ncbi:MAG: M20 family metallopeptidase [Candidatus Omnitrophica bacterium]|nr:M20 family metallopeptidase [Candidatus Omnitrophota bacterium]
MVTPQIILKETFKLKPWLIKLRRHFHQYPELSWQEFKTSARVERELKKLNIEVKRIAKTGVVGILNGKKKGKCVAIRADMDALPIQEKTNKPYASKIYNVMHACGHDAKIAIVLGVAKLLRKMRDKLKGSVKFIFQPNEEGSGGAELMIKEGVLKNPKVSAIFSVDFDPYLKSGKIGIREGMFFANIDSFEISIFGKGGHGGRLYRAVDVMLVSAKVIEALQYYLPRRFHPCVPLTVSFGEIKAGSAPNVIPDTVVMKGTIRTFAEDVQRELKRKIEEIVRGICRIYKADYRIDYFSYYPGSANNSELNKIVEKVAKEIVGTKNIYKYQYPFFESEDISYFFRIVPGTVFSLGIRNPKKGIIYPAHSPYFDIDEDVLPIGVAVLTGCLIEYLNNQ